MTVAGLPVAVDERAQKFADFFHQKVKNNVELSNINPSSVYNGKCKMIVQNQNFMTKKDVKECMMSLNNKKM